MKKSLLALALMGAFSGAALAQSSVTIYGIVDMGVVRDDNGLSKDGTKYSLDSGNQSSSRLGFKGTEDLGNGLKANFVLEMGLKADTGASDGTTFGRQAFVGLSGDFGAVNFGRQKSLTYVASESIDPFAVGLAGNMNRLFGTVTRVDNAAIYTTPSMSGFSASGLFGFGEKAGNNSKSSVRSLAGTYNAGPVFASVVYEKAYDATVSFAPDVLAAAGMRLEKTLVGGSYDFGVAKAHAAFEQLKTVFAAIGTTPEYQGKANVYMVGVTVPVGAGAFLADYTKFTDKSAGVKDANAQQYALGYTYNLSKRTNLYTSYSYTKNDANSSINVFTTDEKGVAVANDGKSDKLFNVGIRHTF